MVNSQEPHMHISIMLLHYRIALWINFISHPTASKSELSNSCYAIFSSTLTRDKEDDRLAVMDGDILHGPNRLGKPSNSQQKNNIFNGFPTNNSI